jgi:hypothetical protein
VNIKLGLIFSRISDVISEEIVDLYWYPWASPLNTPSLSGPQLSDLSRYKGTCDNNILGVLDFPNSSRNACDSELISGFVDASDNVSNDINSTLSIVWTLFGGAKLVENLCLDSSLTPSPNPMS